MLIDDWIAEADALSWHAPYEVWRSLLDRCPDPSCELAVWIRSWVAAGRPLP